MSFTITVQIADKHVKHFQGMNDEYSICGVTSLEYWNSKEGGLGQHIEDLDYILKTHQIKMDVHKEYFEGTEGSTTFIRFDDGGDIVETTFNDSQLVIAVDELVAAQKNGTLDALIEHHASVIQVEPLI
jgi:hypothetical protein